MSYEGAIARIQEIRQYIAPLSPQATRSAPMGGPYPPAATPAAAPSTATATNFSDLLTQELSRALNTNELNTNSLNTHGLGQLGQVGQTNPLGQVPPGNNAMGEQIVAEASTWIGVPYQWGGNTRSGVDCSGLVKNVLSKSGIEMPRVARSQMTQGTAVPSLDQARPGDLVVFNNGTHIGIYAGNGKMIDAPRPGQAVQLRDVYETPTAIRRVTPEHTAAAVSRPDVSWLNTAALAGMP